MIERLVHHGLLGELGVRLVLVRHKRDAAAHHNAYMLNVTPFTKVPTHDLGRGRRSCVVIVVGWIRRGATETEGRFLVDAAHVERLVHTQHRAYTTHIIAIASVFFAPKNISALIRHLVGPWQAVQIQALFALRAASARKEQAHIRRVRHTTSTGLDAHVRAGIPCVARNIAPGHRPRLGLWAVPRVAP